MPSKQEPPHGPQSGPPQSTPVSEQSCTPFAHLVPLQTPPQSILVSSWFIIPSIHVPPAPIPNELVVAKNPNSNKIENRWHGLRQLGLFGLTDQTVDRLKNAVNHKIGRFALRSGDTLTLPDVYDDKTNEYDICDVQGKMCF